MPSEGSHSLKKTLPEMNSIISVSRPTCRCSAGLTASYVRRQRRLFNQWGTVVVFLGLLSSCVLLSTCLRPHHNILHCWTRRSPHCNTLQHTATHCNTLSDFMYQSTFVWGLNCCWASQIPSERWKKVPKVAHRLWRARTKGPTSLSL